MGIVEEARALIGKPAAAYKGSHLGNSPDAFDCSGFVRFVLGKAGFFVPARFRHSRELFDGYGMLVHAECAKPGDLVFFSRNLHVPTHVGIYSGEGLMIHASRSIGPEVREMSIDDYVRKRGILQRGMRIYAHNPIGYKRPTISDCTQG